ncbi:unnamed protein product [Rotaria magnacalcarata]|nr:unnamed protein product [Rotaria magnacalcarata]CAF1663137.1 unnamed protein product [Rotaria magnacalcarata]CAF1900592.1 unnamed protein product [Rotaria magnacalcarata]CAF4006640.1 unnamed protein product [Rotaria magnacalcarata]CAF4247474.1 unnamed protein product [Rotaria magnacalcarata]
MQATANLQLHTTTTSIGTLTFFQQDANSPVHITGTLRSLNISANHGFHVHVYGVSGSSPNCTAAGGHFNPYNTVHGPRSATIMQRHVGDLGNITTDANGTVTINIQDSIIQFYNATQSIANRTIVVHRMYDDGGMGTGDSNLTGNAGERVACGNIIMMISDGINIKPIKSNLVLTMMLIIMIFFH